MNQSILNKALKINSSGLVPKPLRIDTKNISFYNFYDIELKNTISSLKSTKAHLKNLFFEYFPYETSKSYKDYLYGNIPIFSENLNMPNELITLSNQVLMKEINPFIEYLKSLRFYGSLKQRQNKSVYLTIDDYFIKLISSNMFSQIEKSSDFNLSVISKDEHEVHEVFPIQEIDEKFQFRIKDLYSVNVETENSYQRVWFLEIESKDLEEFRYKYHLFPKINAHNFCLKLGFIKSFKLRKSYPLSKINITFFAA